MQIEELNLSAHAYTVLKRTGLTVEQVMKSTPSDLLRYDGMTVTMLSEIISKLPVSVNQISGKKEKS